jgi:glycosyltransferase involved in cell wall biosynthesis
MPGSETRSATTVAIDMRLAFNATSLLGPLTGIGQYSFHLARELLGRADLRVDLFYGAFWASKLYTPSSPKLTAALPWLRNQIPYSYELRRWLQNLRFYGHTQRTGLKSKFDIYHEPSILPLRFDGPTVITVHDLSWIRHPEAHPVVRVRAMNRYFEKGLQQASAVIVDSGFVKQELIDVFGLASDSITVIPLGADTLFRPLETAQTAATLTKYQLQHGKYFVAVGTLEPRKNLSLAITAYLQLPQRLRNLHPLVLIGMKGWHSTSLDQQLAALIAAGEVRQLGYVPRPELAILMAGALALVYPSIYEGFGLPPLESMACGVPAICANASSLPELVGDAGVLVDPHNDSELVAAYIRMIEDQQWRSDMSDRASLRADRYTWSSCADRTLAVYCSVVT